MIDHLSDEEINKAVAAYKQEIAERIHDGNLRLVMANSFKQGIIRCMLLLQEKESTKAVLNATSDPAFQASLKKGLEDIEAGRIVPRKKK